MKNSSRSIVLTNTKTLAKVHQTYQQNVPPNQIYKKNVYIVLGDQYAYHALAFTDIDSQQ